MVRTHLDYASSVWSPYKAQHVDLLESVSIITKTVARHENPNLFPAYSERLRKFCYYFTVIFLLLI